MSEYIPVVKIIQPKVLLIECLTAKTSSDRSQSGKDAQAHRRSPEWDVSVAKCHYKIVVSDRINIRF